MNGGVEYGLEVFELWYSDESPCCKYGISGDASALIGIIGCAIEAAI